MFKKKYLILALVLGVITVVSSTFFISKRKFDLLPVKQGDVSESIYGLGKVKSNHVYEVKIGFMTNVSKTFVKEGDEVSAGDKLISFSESSLFKAPFPGTITSMEVEQGEIALPQVVLLRLENLQDKYIEVSLEQEAALRVKKNQKATILFENLKTKKFEGSVKSLYPKQGEFLAHINVKDLPENTLPGMTADVVIEVGSKSNAILIPVRAISDGRVVRMRNDKKEKVEVKLGYTDGVWAEILDGDIKKDDQLVVKAKK